MPALHEANRHASDDGRQMLGEAGWPLKITLEKDPCSIE